MLRGGKAPILCLLVPLHWILCRRVGGRDIQLLSWQQSGREAGRQTLVLAGTFASLLSWINDWPAVCPQGTCQILQWEKSETGSVVTVEVTTAGMDGQALH